METTTTIIRTPKQLALSILEQRYCDELYSLLNGDGGARIIERLEAKLEEIGTEKLAVISQILDKQIKRIGSEETPLVNLTDKIVYVLQNSGTFGKQRLALAIGRLLSSDEEDKWTTTSRHNVPGQPDIDGPCDWCDTNNLTETKVRDVD